MTPRPVRRVSLAVAFGLMIPGAATSSAQGSSDRALKARFGIYVNRLLGSAPDAQMIREELDETVSRECANLSRAPGSDDLEKEEEWLRGLRAGATDRGWQAANLVSSVATALADPRTRANVTPEKYREAQSIIADARLEVAVVAEINARVGECIEARRRNLRGERVIHGKWNADCRAAEGITPNETGRLTLQVHADRASVTGTVFPTEGSVGVEVQGRLIHGPAEEDFRFHLQTKMGREPVIDVVGVIDSFYPLAASGTIRLGGEVPPYGRWDCSGSWKSY